MSTPSSHLGASRGVPGHVLTAFLLDDAGSQSRDLGPAWGYGVLMGATAMVPAKDHTHFSATAREAIATTVNGVRVARPLRTSDGRTSVAGWSATSFEPGDIAGRIDETVAVGLRLADALRPLGMPDFETNAGSLTELYRRAEKDAWQECDDMWGRIDAAGQVGHIDLVGTTIYSHAATPVVTDIVPTAAPRPHGYTAVLAMVDGMIYGLVDESILDRYAHIPHVLPLAVRAAFFRRNVNDLHPSSTALSKSNTDSVIQVVVSRLSATMSA